MNAAKQAEWDEAKRRCRLSDAAVAMAKELGLKPGSLIKNIPHKSEPWKAPVENWVRHLHAKRFGQRPPPPRPEPAVEAVPPEPAGEEINQLEAAREELDNKLERGELDEDTFSEAMRLLESETPISAGEINAENRGLLKRRDSYRRFADVFARVAAQLDFVQRIVLFGSVAAPLKKEVPRFSRLRRARVAVWHECHDVDLAIWLSDLTRLTALRRAVSDATNLFQAMANIESLPGVPHHAVDVFLMEPGTDRYRGNLCHYGQCPKGKPECEVTGCGAQPFLRLFEDFEFDRFAPRGEHAVVLFDRAAGQPAQAPAGSDVDPDVPF